MEHPHYSSFRNAVELGKFNSGPIAGYLRHLAADARHIISPAERTWVTEVLDIGAPEASAYLDSFVQRASNGNDDSALKGAVCVEDSVSAVFIDKTALPPGILKVTTYVDVAGRNCLAAINIIVF